MTNEERVWPVLYELWQKVNDEDFVMDKSGVKTVEILGARIELDPTQKFLEFPGRKTPKKYVQAELDWYDSQDLSVKDIGKVADIWNKCACKDGLINSNYGFLIYSEENGNQYLETMDKLVQNPDTRQAVMIYNRPSIHKDAAENGRSDFICTFAHQFFIRNGELHSIANMRSNDGIFGFMADAPWFMEVHQRLYDDLVKSTYLDLKMGKYIHIANSFHIYERHFPMLEKMVTYKPE